MKVIAVGYTGTGSSALVHLLKEYENCFDVDSKNYEHNVLYVPNGIFDLEDVLLNNNSMYRSDAAINSFYREMKNLNDNDYEWFGGFKNKYGDKFMDIVYEFINSLIIYTRPGGWAYDYIYKFGIKNVIKDLVKFCLRKDIKKFGYRIDLNGLDNKTNYALPTPEEFYKAGKIFINKYFEMVGCKKDSIYIFDQIIEPWQLYRVPNYFDNDVKFIVFDRDPRDTFLSQKYVWSKTGSYSIMPTDVNLFIDFYSRMYEKEKKIDDQRILRVRFEDFIYNYSDMVSKIENFVGKGLLGEHKYAREFFNPDISIKNTQVFTANDKWREEVSIMENSKLSTHFYPFPYSHKTTINDVTDPNPDTSKKDKDIKLRR